MGQQKKLSTWNVEFASGSRMFGRKLYRNHVFDCVVFNSPKVNGKHFNTKTYRSNQKRTLKHNSQQKQFTCGCLRIFHTVFFYTDNEFIGAGSVFFYTLWPCLPLTMSESFDQNIPLSHPFCLKLTLEMWKKGIFVSAVFWYMLVDATSQRSGIVFVLHPGWPNQIFGDGHNLTFALPRSTKTWQDEKLLAKVTRP